VLSLSLVHWRPDPAPFPRWTVGPCRQRHPLPHVVSKQDTTSCRCHRILGSLGSSLRGEHAEPPLYKPKPPPRRQFPSMLS
jgi:hypothetical protein